MIIYLAGPFSSDVQWERESNSRLMAWCAYQVFQNGDVPLYTHRMYGELWGMISEEQARDAGIALLHHADMLVLCGDYESSEGTMLELAEARRRGTPDMTWEQYMMMRAGQAMAAEA